LHTSFVYFKGGQQSSKQGQMQPLAYTNPLC